MIDGLHLQRLTRWWTPPGFSRWLTGRGASTGGGITIVEPDAALVRLLRDSSRVLVFTGPGVSDDRRASDVQPLREPWPDRAPVPHAEFMRSEDARGLYWEAKLADWEAGRDTRPNSIHGAIVLLERAHKLEAIVTQNTDGLQRVAGTSASRLVELHGTDWCVECQRCEARGEAVPHYEAFRHTRQPPRCACGGPLKLATISSGQALREEDLEQAGRAAAGADLVVALGADLAAYPASSVPLLAAQGGAPYVIISRGLTEHDDHPLVRLRLSGDIADLFVTAVYLSCHG